MSKLITFFIMAWLGLAILGSVLQGSGGVVVTKLTASITSTTTSPIAVTSTNGFPSSGFVVIGGERISYTTKDSTHFGTAGNPNTRGYKVDGIGGSAVVHTNTSEVSTVEVDKLKQMMDHTITTIQDASGPFAFITIGYAFFSMLGQVFFKMPFDMLGTDLAFITYIWAALGIGALVSIVLSRGR
jgi:hypothetical protein